ncbi:PstS family phosphate ABC transporter substrate-binding protein [Nitrincola tapanii]|nr:phosphate ABC transporter substrate-binding protein [Nitrincola tapanii]
MLLLSLSSLSLAQAAQDQHPDYSARPGVSGSLSSMGSETLNSLMTLWAEHFQSYYPGINLQLQGFGSSTGAPALTEGTALFAPMSRAMRPSEISRFEQRYGYPPLALPIAIDLVAVFVHRHNPLQQITLAELDAIFSENRFQGYPQAITHWGQLGLDAPWQTRKITRFSRNAVSGTYGYFKEKVLLGGDFRAQVNEQPGSSSVVLGVGRALNGIGYSGIGFRNPAVKTLALALSPEHPYAEPSAENVVNGHYPLARYLYLYVNKPPQGQLDPLQREFIRFIYSKQGQALVEQEGYLPLPAELSARLRHELELD